MSFSEYKGDLMGLPTDENHINFRWDNPDCKILFSMCRQGNGVCCHYASDKKGLRKLTYATKEFMNFVFNTFDWCEMIFAKIKSDLEPMKRRAKKLGFTFLTEEDNCEFYVLPKEKYYE